MGWWPALAVSAVVAAGLGLACDVLLRGLREQIVPALVALLGASALLLAGVNAVWGSEPKILPPPSTSVFRHGGDLEIAQRNVVTLLVAAAIGAALTVFFRKTRLGLALRAQRFDPEGARMAGVDPAVLSRLAWVLSSVLGAVAMTLALQVVVNTYEATVVYIAFAVGRCGGRRVSQLAASGPGRRDPRSRAVAVRTP